MKNYSSKELSEILNIGKKYVLQKAKREEWQSQARSGRGGGFEWVFSSMPASTQAAIKQAEQNIAIIQEASLVPVPVSSSEKVINVIDYNNIELSQDKHKVALARADLLRLYLEFQEDNKSVARKEEFIELYANGKWYYLLEIVGEVSWKTLERWKKQSKEKTNAIQAIADKRGIARKGQSVLSAEHERVILGQVLNTNAPLISQCVRRIHKRCDEMGLNKPSEATIRRFVTWHKQHCYDEFILFRKGKKAWNDECSISVLRDWSLINVGDVLIADGHTLNFETINPETGKPKRMTLLLFYDGASSMPVGWEIMPTENTACISSAFRRACIMLGKLPRVVYIDNGRAFRSEFFEGSKDLQQVGIFGLYEALGVQVVHAWAYHGQSKPIERFFSTFLDMEVFTASYVGNSIANKPARLHRNEKLHQKLHEKLGGRPLTLEETHYAIGQWFGEYAARPSRAKHLKGTTPGEVFMAGRGNGLSDAEIARLDMLMLQKTVRTITKDGFRLNGKTYWSEQLTARRHSILVRYCDIKTENVKVYAMDGSFICEAYDRDHYKIATGVHPMASILGTDEQKNELQRAITLKKGLEKDSSAHLLAMTEHIIEENRQSIPKIEVKKEVVKTVMVEETISPEELRIFEERRAELLAIEDAKPRYEVTTKKFFKDSLARYEYIFNKQYVEQIELYEEDKKWANEFEQSEQFNRYRQRYDDLKEHLALHANVG